MKKHYIVLLMLGLLLLSACAAPEPTISESSLSDSPAELTPPPVTPTPASRTAEEVLPPIEKDIFESKSDYYQSISAGTDGCAVILVDGSLVAVGETTIGGASAVSGSKYGEPKAVFSDISSVFCSQFDTLAIDKDGTLWGWGMIKYWGNIIGAPAEFEVPYRLLTDVQMASADLRSYLALRKDGTVWVWGSGENGVMGNGSEYLKYTSDAPLLEPVKVLESAVFAKMSGGRCCAIKTDGSLWFWGNMGVDPKTNKSVCYDRPVHIMDDVKSVSGRFVVKDDGTLWALNEHWADMSDESRRAFFYGIDPVQIMENVSYATGGIRFFVIKTDGSLWCWGDNFNGALGNGSDEYIAEPIKISDNVAAVDSSLNNTYILKNNGELWEAGAPHGSGFPNSGAENAPSEQEFFRRCLPHKILDRVLIN